jgi:hypothetical protein
VSCPICAKRKPGRFCPAKGEKICAVCCGTEREVTLDCPADCPHLKAARRYEDEQRKPEPAELPFSDVTLSSEIVYERQAILAGLALAVVQAAARHEPLNDADALAALRALAETYKTLLTGIYYQRPPDAPLPRVLYEELVGFLKEAREEEAKRAGFATTKDSEVFHLLVFLLRLASFHTNGRPRSRRFLQFLRSQFAQQPSKAAPEVSRIVLP